MLSYDICIDEYHTRYGTITYYNVHLLVDCRSKSRIYKDVFYLSIL